MQRTNSARRIVSCGARAFGSIRLDILLLIVCYYTCSFYAYSSKLSSTSIVHRELSSGARKEQTNLESRCLLLMMHRDLDHLFISVLCFPLH